MECSNDSGAVRASCVAREYIEVCVHLPRIWITGTNEPPRCRHPIAPPPAIFPEFPRNPPSFTQVYHQKRLHTRFIYVSYQNRRLISDQTSVSYQNRRLISDLLVCLISERQRGCQNIPHTAAFLLLRKSIVTLCTAMRYIRIFHPAIFPYSLRYFKNTKWSRYSATKYQKVFTGWTPPRPGGLLPQTPGVSSRTLADRLHLGETSWPPAEGNSTPVSLGCNCFRGVFSLALRRNASFHFWKSNTWGGAWQR